MVNSAMPCVRQIMKLDQDDALYEEMLSEPLVKDGKVHERL
jgi:hypothetical protein